MTGERTHSLVRKLVAGILTDVAVLATGPAKAVRRYTVIDLRIRIQQHAARSGCAPTSAGLRYVADEAVKAITAALPEGASLAGWLDQATPEELSVLLVKAADALKGEVSQ